MTEDDKKDYNSRAKELKTAFDSLSSEKQQEIYQDTAKNCNTQRNEKNYEHIHAYPEKMAERYKDKYDIDIEIVNMDDISMNEDVGGKVLEKLQSGESCGLCVFPFDNHADGVLLHDNKAYIMELSKSSATEMIKASLEIAGVDPDQIYTMKPVHSSKGDQKHLQTDYDSCAVYAMKTMKRCLQDDAALLSNAVLDEDSKEFILPPSVFKDSQSPTFLKKEEKAFKKSGGENTDKDNEVEKWRKDHKIVEENHMRPFRSQLIHNPDPIFEKARKELGDISNSLKNAGMTSEEGAAKEEKSHVADISSKKTTIDNDKVIR